MKPDEIARGNSEEVIAKLEILTQEVHGLREAAETGTTKPGTTKPVTKEIEREYLVAASQVALSMLAFPSVRKGPIQFLAFTPAALSLVARPGRNTMASVTIPSALIGLAALVGPKLFK